MAQTIEEYHDLDVHCNMLLLVDVFESFHNQCIDIYEVDPTHFLEAPGLPLEAFQKKTDVEMELLMDVDMLLMVEKRIRGGMCHTFN